MSVHERDVRVLARAFDAFEAYEPLSRRRLRRRRGEEASDSELVERQAEVVARAALEVERLERRCAGQAQAVALLLRLVGEWQLDPREVVLVERARLLADGQEEDTDGEAEREDEGDSDGVGPGDDRAGDAVGDSRADPGAASAA